MSGVKNLLQAISVNRLKPYIIFSSSAAVYKPKDGPLYESDPVGPIEIYGHSKLESEELIEAFANDYGINYTIVRLFNVYGSGDHNNHIIPAIIRQMNNKG